MKIIKKLRHLLNMPYSTSQIISLAREFSHQLRYNPQAPFYTLIASMMIFGLVGGLYLFFIDGINPTDWKAIESDTMSKLPTPDSIFTRSLIFFVIALLFMIIVRSYKATFLVSFGVGSTIALIIHLGMYRSPSDVQLGTYQHYVQHCPRLVDEMAKRQLTVEDYSFLRIKNLNAYAAYHCPDVPVQINL